MALGTATRNSSKSSNSAKPVYFDFLTMVGDAAYTSGGTTGFDAYVKAVTGIGDGREIMGVIAQDCAGYDVRYKPAGSGTLMMYEEGADGGAADEVANGDYSSVTLTMLVISQ